MGNLFAALKRRKVFRVSAVYVVVAWILIQVADVVLPTFGAPAWVNQTIIFVFILGFPLALVLAWAYEITPAGIKSDSEAQAQAVVGPSGDHKLIYATFFMVLILAGIQIGERFLALPQSVSNTETAGASVLRAEITVPEALTRRGTGVRTQLAISPDGSHLVYGNLDANSRFQIMLRNLETGESSLLTDRASLGTLPEFSPDGRSVLLNANPRILVASVEGGLPEFFTVENMGVGAGSAGGWISNEEIVYKAGNSGFNMLSLSTGLTEELVPEQPGVEVFHPSLLPGGDAVLFTAVSARDSSEIQLFEMATNTTKQLIRGGYLPKFAASGHIVFLRDGDLWAVPFDLDSLELAGQASRVIANVDSQPFNSMASYAFSQRGRLVYLEGPAIGFTSRPISWIDRHANEELIPIDEGSYRDPALAPDGSLLALTSSQTDGTTDIWVYDFQRGTLNKRTFHDDAMDPVWSADGSQIFYQRNIANELWRIQADGSGQAERLLSSERPIPLAYSAVDDALIFTDGPAGSADIHALRMQDSAWVATPVLDGPDNEWDAAVSPDGRWIAFTSGHPFERRGTEIYVSPYPDTANILYQVSSGGGREPKWGPGSDELFFLDTRNNLISVRIETENGFSPGRPETVATGFFVNPVNTPSYAIAPDGERFLRLNLAEGEVRADFEMGQTTLTIVENWFDELRRLAPAEEN